MAKFTYNEVSELIIDLENGLRVYNDKGRIRAARYRQLDPDTLIDNTTLEIERYAKWFKQLFARFNFTLAEFRSIEFRFDVPELYLFVVVHQTGDEVAFDALVALKAQLPEGVVIQVPAAAAASTANVVGTYNNVGGSTLFGEFTVMPDIIDGYNLQLNDIVLLKDQTNQIENGLWQVTTVGTGADGVWERIASFSDLIPNVFYVEVVNGVTNANTYWLSDELVVVGGINGAANVFTSTAVTPAVAATIVQAQSDFNALTAEADAFMERNWIPQWVP